MLSTTNTILSIVDNHDSTYTLNLQGTPGAKVAAGLTGNILIIPCAYAALCRGGIPVSEMKMFDLSASWLIDERIGSLEISRLSHSATN